MQNNMPLTPEQEAFLAEFSSLPPVIARKEVEYFLGGLVARKTLANADARGEGPEMAWAVGRNVAYRTRSLLEWVLKNFEIKRLVFDVQQELRPKGKPGREQRKSSGKEQAVCL